MPLFSRRPDIENLKARRNVRGLIAALEDVRAREDIRVAAATPLGERGKVRKVRRAVESLIGVLQDKPWRIRAAAAEALGKLGDARAVEPLICTLQDRNWLVSLAVAGALGELGDAR